MLNMPNFSKTLERYKEELGYHQYWRYSGGRVPQWLIWLMERPDLAQALADDAKAHKEEPSTKVMVNGSAD